MCLANISRKNTNYSLGSLWIRLRYQNTNYSAASHRDFTLPPLTLSGVSTSESSERIRERVLAAREIQTQRFAPYPEVYCNAQMTPRLMQLFARPDTEGLEKLRLAMERLDLSARAYDRILKVARTIADLAGSEEIRKEHIAEAIHYRSLDRASWGQR